MASLLEIYLFITGHQAIGHICDAIEAFADLVNKHSSLI